MLGDHGRATSGGGRARARAHAPEPVQPCSGARRSRPADVLRTRACGQRTGQLPQLASALGGGSLARNFLQTPRCGVVFVCGRDVVGLRAAQQGTSAISEMRAIPRSILGARRRPRPYREHGGGAPAADQTVLADRIQIARIVCPLARAHRRAMPGVELCERARLRISGAHGDNLDCSCVCARNEKQRRLAFQTSLVFKTRRACLPKGTVEHVVQAGSSGLRTSLPSCHSPLLLILF
mmetsp:Transcript_11077/g.29000  ORF Transcript_11077/g.29000 Transcript_11077/m.29000 type:complete len:237 (+) Transcript_11077:83-793(+)|eukprot:CAMPEP_0179851606 /NCGR_PEP_ID=MMETSP0982-20121206/8343_1 /TAXON_ID=483367 /ORGANISM="non described non described, Strain CCMP 2436" /LENGTH=236 /DNA_ID=CAMNT_0021737143 /DNA_START=102 /DNA_END=812 /DNA_ORIENTATION=-